MIHFFPQLFLIFSQQKSLYSQNPFHFLHLSKHCSDKPPNVSWYIWGAYARHRGAYTLKFELPCGETESGSGKNPSCVGKRANRWGKRITSSGEVSNWNRRIFIMGHRCPNLSQTVQCKPYKPIVGPKSQLLKLAQGTR